MADVPARDNHPLGGLYEFVRNHLSAINTVIFSSCTVVGVLDFFAPRLSLVPQIIYTATACLVALMLLAGFAPGFLAKAGFVAERARRTPLWKKPGWQVATVILSGVTILGFASVAKASQGGAIASAFPAARQMQGELLGLRADIRQANAGIDSANGKLDQIIARSNDPKKDLVSSGYSFDNGGLQKAIKQGDAEAVGLFDKARFRVLDQGPMATILTGQQSWSDDVAQRLTRDMFGSDAACREQSRMLAYDLPAPATKRVELFKKLCDAAPAIAMLEKAVAGDRAGPAPGNDYQARMRAARISHLAILKG